MTQEDKKETIFIITGLSGAGLSTALGILEDLGFNTYANLPLPLLQGLLDHQKPHHSPIAIAIDTRTKDFDPVEILKAVTRLKQNQEWDVKTIFLMADDSALLKRFSETRRTHPLARDRSVSDGIAAEKALVYPLKHKADLSIDTSEFSIHDLRRTIEGYVSGIRTHQLNINVMSFAYKHGIPREADIIFDMRFLRNPNWVPDLKEKTGRESDVQQYVVEDPNYFEFERNLRNIFNLTVPAYVREGKNYLTIAFGCSGGRHRSVTVAERISG